MPDQQTAWDRYRAKSDHRRIRRPCPRHFPTVTHAIKGSTGNVSAIGDQAKACEKRKRFFRRDIWPSYCHQQQRHYRANNRPKPYDNSWRWIRINIGTRNSQRVQNYAANRPAGRDPACTIKPCCDSRLHESNQLVVDGQREQRNWL